MPLDSLERHSVRAKPARKAPDDASRILLAAAETIDREGYEHGWQVSHAIRMAAEKVMGLGPVYASLWFERALGRLHRQDPKRRSGKKRTTADWVSRLREAAEIEPLENPRWPPQYGWWERKMPDPCAICGVTLEKDKDCCGEPDCPEWEGNTEEDDG